MPPRSHSLFDFDYLDAVDDGGPATGKPTPCVAPPPGPAPPCSDATQGVGPPELVAQLQGDCERAGLSVGWCVDAEELRRLLAASAEWDRWGLHTLRGECTRLGVCVPEV
mmetsp:Transcript_9291/g.26106  ORF Transcript_9291/g.26106 Transcript_9291/m.26106 type:complete len:110 (-) Transcript_9291:48-377(-)